MQYRNTTTCAYRHTTNPYYALYIVYYSKIQCTELLDGFFELQLNSLSVTHTRTTTLQ